ncbi:hypothetical protein NST11_18575 [Caldifermentibacillus hisashii]|uniref:Uncharacterized protein n=1 Tax=Aeribacillus pallidus TaxID=33936 RepID=A0A223E3E3_9BACI|nr:hypothetical protein [Aeribacillus pallidus]ASS89645.1 hypothetical protein AP3564_04690 [Aeribacillus pallidus]
MSDDVDNINLFRNIGFMLFQQGALDTMLGSMDNGTDNQLEIPNINSRIYSPAILVIPIAIYS